MGIKDLTIDDFKELFARNFPYLPVWVEDKAYFTGDVVYADPNFYESLVDNNTQPVADTESWKVINLSLSDYVQDSDIERAWAEALTTYNEALGGEDYKVIFLYLVAFYLSYDLQLTSAGAYGQVSFPATSVTVGSVSESYYVPEVYVNDPILSFYTRNGFGLKYLNMVYPRMVGNTRVVAGWSLP